MHLPRQYCIMIGSRMWEFQRPYSWQPFCANDGNWYIMGNYLYTCPVCGEQWARAWCTDPRHAVNYWEVVAQPCEHHTLPKRVCCDSIPGSLFPGTWGVEGMRDAALFYYLPPELIQREFNLHIRRLLSNG